MSACLPFFMNVIHKHACLPSCLAYQKKWNSEGKNVLSTWTAATVSTGHLEFYILFLFLLYFFRKEFKILGEILKWRKCWAGEIKKAKWLVKNERLNILLCVFLYCFQGIEFYYAMLYYDFTQDEWKVSSLHFLTKEIAVAVAVVVTKSGK